MELREVMLKYKEVSVELINEIKRDGNIDGAIEKREALISEMKRLNYTTEEFKSIVEELNILSIEKEAESELNKIKAEIKKEMMEIKKKKEAARGYGANFKNINFINKQI